MAKKTPKQTALNHVLESMAEIKTNLKIRNEPEHVRTNAEAMLKLTEAYVKIETIDGLEELRETIKSLSTNI